MLYVWPVGLVASFSLWVREVPGSTPGQAPGLLFCQNNLQAVMAKTFFGFLYYYLFGPSKLR